MCIHGLLLYSRAGNNGRSPVNDRLKLALDGCPSVYFPHSRIFLPSPHSNVTVKVRVRVKVIAFVPSIIGAFAPSIIGTFVPNVIGAFVPIWS